MKTLSADKVASMVVALSDAVAMLRSQPNAVALEFKTWDHFAALAIMRDDLLRLAVSDVAVEAKEPA